MRTVRFGEILLRLAPLDRLRIAQALPGHLETAFAAAQSAYDNLAAINKQIYDTVEKSVEANVETATATAKRTSKKR